MSPHSRRDHGVLPAYLEFRGKARPEGASALWHPVAYHCLDVAACVEAILAARPVTLARGAAMLGLTADEARRLLPALAVLHDVGKFSETFYRQDIALWPSVRGAYQGGRAKPHGIAGQALWKRDLSTTIAPRLIAGAPPRDLEPLMAATFGHHGRPVAVGLTPWRDEHFANATGRDAAIAFVGDVIALVCETPVNAPAPWRRLTKRASWWVSGIVSIADWIGSRQTWFAYYPPSLGLADYWDVARERAGRAIRESGLIPPLPAASRTFAELTGVAKQPSPLQQWALDVALPEGPSLIIIEDVTGSGKTEAAQVLVHRMMAAGRATGAYWGMPTQATANAMYGRQRDTITALFDGAADARPSLMLAHGQSKLYGPFRATVLDGAAVPEAGAADRDDEENGIESTVACSAFLADDRRASLLADVGAGTIDQALLAVLPSRFNTIRLVGLADKVLVLDEIHAYDAYVEGETEALLEFQAALGGAAILLSATLTQKQRERFAMVWRESVVAGNVPRLPATGVAGADVPYPFTTIVNGVGECTQTPISAAPWSVRDVPVVFVHDEADVVERIVRAAAEGQAVVWIRNTVDSVLRAAELLLARGIEAMVFHARFAQGDRQMREAEVMSAFGREPTAARARVLVASQVVEQSLDLDFDMLVTDLAPIDLLFQRSGRLWRHERRNRPAARMELIVLGPRFTETPGKEWLDEVLPKVAYVYTDLGVMWRTTRELHHDAHLVTPGGVRKMIESVYADDEVPASLEAAAGRATGRAAAHGALARNFSLRVDDGYCAEGTTNWLADVRVPTRLIDEQTVLRLARIGDNGELVPFCPSEESHQKAWALSEVRVSARKVPADAKAEARYESAIARVRETWPRYERELLIVPLQPDAFGWTGKLLSGSGTVIPLPYDSRTGLRL
ncbi:CRISPR-associated helicase/endonuclease Cas3 [soil metagenome]